LNSSAVTTGGVAFLRHVDDRLWAKRPAAPVDERQFQSAHISGHCCLERLGQDSRLAIATGVLDHFAVTTFQAVDTHIQVAICCVDFQMPFFSQVPLRGKGILRKVTLCGGCGDPP